MPRLPHLFIAIFLTSGIVSAADIFIDPDYSGPEDGSFLKPYNSWNDITFSSTDDYYQRCGTKITVTSSIQVTASGTSSDPIIIGAYYDDGGPVIESEEPSFGEFCSNGAAKPIIENNDFDNSVMVIEADHVELNSIQLKQGSTTLYIHGSHNSVKYSRIGWGAWGIRIGIRSPAEHNYVGYSYVFTDMGHEAHDSANTDGIICQKYSRNCLIEYNVVDGWDHAAIATDGRGPVTGHEIRFNYILSWDDEQSECMIVDGNSNRVHHNWCEDAGVVQMEGRNHIFAYNIIDNTISTKIGHAAIQMITVTKESVNITVANNVIYYDGTQGFDMSGIRFGAGDPHVQKNNLIVNNIVMNSNMWAYSSADWGDGLGYIADEPDDPDANIWRNNIAYNWARDSDCSAKDDPYDCCTGPDAGTCAAARIQTAYYKTATEWNTYVPAHDNLDLDPDLKNPSAGQFWPDDADDPVVGKGYNLGPGIDKIMDPSTDFTAEPPNVILVDQPEDWYIGAFALPGSSSCTDADGDGYGPGCNGADCDDNNADVYAEIICSYDGRNCGAFSLCVTNCPVPPSEDCGTPGDEDCDGRADCTDSDCAAHPSCTGSSEFYTYYSKSINIDGTLEDSWTEPVTFTNPTKSDNTAAVYGSWDDDYLYFAFDVYDSDLEAVDGNDWEDDGAEIMLDVLHDATSNMNSDDRHYIVTINGVRTPGLLFAKEDNGDGYVMEIGIPWSMLGTTPDYGKSMGLLLGNNDRDDGISSQFDWLGLIDSGNYVRPNLWGDMILLHRADDDRDGCIDMGEIIAYIGAWKNGDAKIGDLLDAVNIWLSCS